MEDRFKFRANFPKKHGIMQSKPIHYIKSFWEIQSVDGDKLIGFETVDGNRSSCYPDDIVLMQCTGLKDKNGKLIYEGDIVKTYIGYFIIKYCDACKSFQLFSNEEDNFCFACIGDFHWFEFLEFLDKAEIIGNIHENSELIETKE